MYTYTYVCMHIINIVIITYQMVPILYSDWMAWNIPHAQWNFLNRILDVVCSILYTYTQRVNTL